MLRSYGVLVCTLAPLHSGQ